ncbi:MAG: J domain-containing protein [Thermoplasmata archaeon]|nr:J domain-containing protein [Thermoplasmata archaeon]
MSGKRVLIAFLLLASFIISTVPMPSSGEMVTRAGEGYSMTAQGSGVDDDNSIIFLAGYDWYEVEMNFSNIVIGDVTWINMSVVEKNAGQLSFDLFSFNTGISTLSSHFSDGQVEVRSPDISSIVGENFTFSFEILFHLNWSHNDKITFKPVVTLSDNTVVRPVIDSVVTVQVFGSLDTPVIGDVFDSLDRIIEQDDVVSANTSIHFSSIDLFYYHPNPAVNLTGLSPMYDEITLQLTIGTSSWNGTISGGSFTADVQLPAMEQGIVEIGMAIPNMPSSGKMKVEIWDYALEVDGMGPTFTLKKPVEKSPTEDVNWSIDIQEVPKEYHIDVDGTSTEYQYKNAGGNWSEWIPAEDVEDGHMITVNGTTTCMIGEGNTHLRFRAKDALGNLGISEDIPIHVNTPPIVLIPEIFKGRSYLQNDTLSLVGSELSSDQDDTNLIYKYYFNGDEFTGEKLNKSLFTVYPGEYTVMVEARDPWGSVGSASFDITVIEVKEEVVEETLIEQLLEPPMIYLVSFVLIVILIVILVVVILVISKKVRDNNRNDFILDEDGLDDGSAAEIARRLQEMYAQQQFQAAPAIDEDAAINDDEDEFSFNYNLYEVLSVELTSEEKEIKRSYRKLAAFYHPDRVNLDDSIDSEEAMEMMVMVNKAKEILLNQELKVRYDAYIGDVDFELEMEE